MTKLEREFLDRSLSSQDAIYAKLVCLKCSKNGAVPMFEILEYEEEGRTYFVCTCQKCGTTCTVDLHDGPADAESQVSPEDSAAE